MEPVPERVSPKSARRKCHKLCVLVGDGSRTSSKLALKMARAFYHTGTDELHFVTSVSSEEHRTAAELRMKALVEPEQHRLHSFHVVVQDDDYTQHESLARFLSQLSPELILMGSTSLCSAKPAVAQAPRRERSLDASGPNAMSPSHRAGYGSVALKILAEVLAVRSAPVLLVKLNTRGAFLTSPNPSAMKCMVDLQANSRHVLDWLFETFEPGRDKISLTVSQAYDAKNNPKPLAQRLLTAFGVQAACNSFDADKHLFREPASKALPQAVADAEADVLVVQAPRCRGLPAQLTELLYNVKSSILIWPADHTASA